MTKEEVKLFSLVFCPKLLLSSPSAVQVIWILLYSISIWFLLMYNCCDLQNLELVIKKPW